jgi:IS5 family transposase
VKVRGAGRIVPVAVTIAVGVNADGRREVLGMAVRSSEAEPFWLDFLRILKRRGLAGVKLVVSMPTQHRIVSGWIGTALTVDPERYAPTRARAWARSGSPPERQQRLWRPALRRLDRGAGAPGGAQHAHSACPLPHRGWRIEKVFGTWTRSYGLRRMRWFGLAKAGLQARLAVMAYNLRRTLALLQQGLT